MNTFTKTLALALVATAGLVATAHAEDISTRTVYYGDLNLSNASGVQTLYVRIRSAARAVCPQSNSSDLESRAARKECVDKAIDKAVQEVNVPALAALSGAKPVHTASR